MFRMLRLEAKRSVALALFLVLAALTRVFLWMDVQEWAAAWTPLLFSMRSTALTGLPAVLAAGIWHGGRERRSGVTELFAATPRSGPVRLLPAVVVLAGAAVLAVAAVTGWAAAGVSGRATFNDGQWPLGLAVGLLAVAAVALLGLGIGRLAPAPVAAPLGAVLLFLVLVLGAAGDGRPVNRLVDTVLPMLPVTDGFHRVLPALSAAQILWFTGLGVTGVLLAVAATTRTRALAAIPAAAGLGLGVLVAPAGAIAPAPGATALVCATEDARVCVTRVHSRALPDLLGPARTVLDAFAAVPGGPRRVQEDQLSWMLDADRGAPGTGDPDTVLIGLSYRTRQGGIRWKPDDVRDMVARGALVDQRCYAEGAEGWPRADAATRAVTTLLLGTSPDRLGPEARTVHDSLRALPAEERARRIGEARAAGLTCGDPMAALTGEGAVR
ncbi:hypothetical protein GCM10009639_03960 [Kitasatospora putterlickiae]|uniref:Integral membrane protein n=1 Tax=Kitasatospora putterlickiae TaxID=221725 RepID=A0ABN1XM66_9ACTN